MSSTSSSSSLPTSGSFDDVDLDGSQLAPDVLKTSHPVSPEEVAIISAELAASFPHDAHYLSADYVKSVASKPYSSDPSQRRPIEYTIEKLSGILAWRAESRAPEVFDLVHSAMQTIPATDARTEDYERSVALASTLNNHSTYLHGLDKTGRPILWLRTERKPWYLADVDAEVNLHILMVDAAIKLMPKGVTDFVVVVDTSSVPPPSPTFLVAVLQGLVRGYPDRLHRLYSAPLGRVVHSATQLVLPLAPKALAEKLVLMEEVSVVIQYKFRSFDHIRAACVTCIP
jgi:hypothetical protein